MRRSAKTMIWCTVFVLVCLASSIGGCGVRRTASLAAIAALVQQRPSGSAAPIAVPPNTSVTFYEGDSVTVDPSGRANLTITGCILEIYWGTKLTLKLGSASAPACAITLEQGTIVVDATAGTEIDTPWATITSFGTRYFVRVNAAQEVLWVIVREGSLTLNPLQEGLPSVELTPRTQTWMLGGAAPVPPRPATRLQLPSDDPRFPPLESLGMYTQESVTQQGLTDAVWLP